MPFRSQFGTLLQIIDVLILEIRRDLYARQFILACPPFVYGIDWFSLTGLNRLVDHKGVCKVFVIAVFRLKIEACFRNLLLRHLLLQISFV